MRTSRVSLANVEGRRYLSQKEAADYLGLSARFLSRETAAGELPVIRVGEGKALKYDRVDLDAYMAKRRQGGPHL